MEPDRRVRSIHKEIERGRERRVLTVPDPTLHCIGIQCNSNEPTRTTNERINQTHVSETINR